LPPKKVTVPLTLALSAPPPPLPEPTALVTTVWLRLEMPTGIAVAAWDEGDASTAGGGDAGCSVSAKCEASARCVGSVTKCDAAVCAPAASYMTRGSKGMSPAN
jgi:hypothetical protein